MGKDLLAIISDMEKGAKRKMPLYEYAGAQGCLDD